MVNYAQIKILKIEYCLVECWLREFDKNFSPMRNVIMIHCAFLFKWIGEKVSLIIDRSKIAPSSYLSRVNFNQICFLIIVLDLRLYLIDKTYPNILYRENTYFGVKRFFLLTDDNQRTSTVEILCFEKH